MSHHRETVTAAGAPEAAGPYSHAVKSGGLIFLSGQTPVDPDIVAGQGSLGLELLEDVPDLAKVVVPVGGGGLASGVAIAIKSER
ncbi:MAG TPA: pyridoxal-phosphate dependent enzyme, partial [Chloroflexota bacterium]|nr:pyridoxal-phosphate dependent enzyme [Chloroflexota bacterium]